MEENVKNEKEFETKRGGLVCLLPTFEPASTFSTFAVKKMKMGFKKSGILHWFGLLLQRRCQKHFWMQPWRYRMIGCWRLQEKVKKVVQVHVSITKCMDYEIEEISTYRKVHICMLKRLDRWQSGGTNGSRLEAATGLPGRRTRLFPWSSQVHPHTLKVYNHSIGAISPLSLFANNWPAATIAHSPIYKVTTSLTQVHNKSIQPRVDIEFMRQPSLISQWIMCERRCRLGKESLDKCSHWSQPDHIFLNVYS